MWPHQLFIALIGVCLVLLPPVQVLPTDIVINININSGSRQLVINGTEFENSVFRDDYEKFGNSFYKYQRVPTPWGKAKKVCEVEGAHLAISNSVTETEHFQKLMRKYNDSTYVYLGFHDLFIDGDFVTIKDEPLEGSGYALWNKREPNGGTKENCGTMHWSGRLNDYLCTRCLPFICEREIDSTRVDITPNCPTKNETAKQDDEDDPHPFKIDWRFGAVDDR